jgi:outer membrane protein assembly factor BamB
VIAVAAVVAMVIAARGSAQVCTGDCDHDGSVTIAELLTGVDIALGNAPVSTCVALDVDGDGVLSVNELIAAVQNALHGCPAGRDASVLEHHHHPSRDGVYVIPQLTKEHAASLAIDPTFAPVIAGKAYAQALYVADAAGHDVVFVATEENQVSAFLAADGSVVWQRTLAPPMRRSALPCGNIDPLGITGTPIIDAGSRTLFLDAMTDAGGGTARHMIYALSIDDGSTRSGWPVDINATVAAGGIQFDSTVQNQRGALALVGGRLYVAYGGHYGDCGNYYGWVIGIAIDDPASFGVFRAHDRGVAIWGPSGIASEGANLFVTTGNGFGGPEWGDSEAILRLAPGPSFDRADSRNYFVPADWARLDARDIDLAGTGPVLVDLPGAVHPELAVALGKDGKMYVADRTNLGGIGGQLLSMQVASNAIINAAATYRTAGGTYIVFKGNGVNCPNGTSGTVTAVRLLPTDPLTAEIAWCANSGGLGSPMVTQTQLGGGDSIVWVVGSEGDKKLHGFDADSGAEVFAGGTDAETLSGNVRRYVTPIAATGRIFVAGDDKVYAFK